MYRMTDSPDQPTDAGVQDRVPLPGSERPATGVRPAAASVPPDETIEITVVLRRRAEVPESALSRVTPLSRDEFARTYGADPADVDLVTRTLTESGAEVVEVDPASRRLRMAGTVGVLCTIFGTSLDVATEQEPDGTVVTYRQRTGNLSVPAVLDGVVTAVLGLDDRPQTRTRFQIAAPAAVTTSYTPPQLAEIYQFPAGTDGTGRTVAILELGGGFTQAELTTYFRSLGITPPKVTAVGVDGGANRPEQNPNGADGEVMLDIEIVGAMAPGADIVVYFAPNTDAGFLDALSQAAHADTTPVAISISWGQSEDAWTAQARTAFDQALTDATALGVTVTAAAGDNGSSDGATDGKVHTDFPASSPHALACGGTRLDANPATGVVNSEVVWNNGVGSGATGGGVSDAFGLPSWQTTVGVPTLPGRPGRGVPDVAANADPQTGYQVLVDGQKLVFGGTSAVSPLWAALLARMAQSLGRPFGLLQPAIYAGVGAGVVADGFRDITSGNNGAYRAGPGWDACTGLGVPVGEELLTALR
jgi:kumamolisin